jgi:hypothetical protein
MATITFDVKSLKGKDIKRVIFVDDGNQRKVRVFWTRRRDPGDKVMMQYEKEWDVIDHPDHAGAYVEKFLDSLVPFLEGLPLIDEPEVDSEQEN